MMSLLSSRVPLSALAAGLAALGCAAAQAQDYGSGHFPQTTGDALYKGICQGCHMPAAQGAVGAGAYPALARDDKLAGPAYPALMVIAGHNAMPAFGDYLTDAQIAAVVNYVRSNFGNHYADKITPEAVAALRPPK
jgi:mono/diheme cytochrome c family protein